jgi:hypothetical protein
MEGTAQRRYDRLENREKHIAMNDIEALNAKILAEFRSRSSVSVEAGLVRHHPTPGGLGPAWLGAEAELVFGFVCRPGEPFAPSRGRPPLALAASSIAALVLCGSLALALWWTYAGYEAVLCQNADESNVSMAREKALVYGEIVAAIVAIVTFSLWYRALTDRARAVATLQPIYSTKYALVTLLIPVANLFAPIQTFSHLWVALSQRKERDRHYLPGFILSVWWCMVLSTFVAGRIAAVSFPRIIDKESLARALASSQRAHLAYAVVCTATVLIIVLFTRRLTRARERALQTPEQLQAWPVERHPNDLIALGTVLVGVIAMLLAGASLVKNGHSSLPLFLVSFIASLRSLWKRAVAIPVSELMYRDQRRPILILRAFKSDGKLRVGQISLEEVVEKVACEYGPVVALGRPGESIPTAGASRLYVPQHDWQSIARALIDNARFVIITCLPGNGLRWELEQLCASGQLGKIVFVPAIVGSRRRCWDTWNEFLRICPPTLTALLSEVLSLENVLYIVINGPSSVLVFPREKYKPTTYAGQLRLILANLSAQSGRADQMT